MTGFIGTFLQLWWIVTSHNQWLHKTPSIHYWTIRAIYCDRWRITAHTLNTIMTELWLLLDKCSPKWILRSVLTYTPNITPWELNRDHHSQQFTLLRAYLLLWELCVNSITTFRFGYSIYQAMLTEPLPSNSHIHHILLSRIDWLHEAKRFLWSW